MGTREHITLSWVNVYKDEETVTYAVDSDVLAAAKLWQAEQGASTQQFKDRLVEQGAKMDCATGPAEIIRKADGTLMEFWFRDGKGHRDEGPAGISRHPSGSVMEEYWRNGEFRTDVPAVVVRYAGGGSLEGWKDASGEYHRDHGPAVIVRRPDGGGVLGYWNHGECLREVPFAPQKKPPRPGSFSF
jgi:hypothetical protein